MVKLEELDFILFCFESHRKVDALLPDTIAYIDLTFCISGMMHYRYMDRDVYLKAGDAILFPQGSVRTRLETNTPAIYVSFNVAVPDSFTPAVKGFLPNSLRSDTITILESVKTRSNPYPKKKTRNVPHCSGICITKLSKQPPTMSIRTSNISSSMLRNTCRSILLWIR